LSFCIDIRSSLELLSSALLTDSRKTFSRNLHVAGAEPLFCRRRMESAQTLSLVAKTASAAAMIGTAMRLGLECAAPSDHDRQYSLAYCQICPWAIHARHLLIIGTGAGCVCGSWEIAYSAGALLVGRLLLLANRPVLCTLSMTTKAQAASAWYAELKALRIVVLPAVSFHKW
jgi:hypothetical protein